MVSLQIVDTDAFLEMPMSSQLLYFHLLIRADDEGFMGNPKKIMKMIGSNEDDMKVLITKRFILAFKSGVMVIKHWLIHNTIRMDRFNPTKYEDEKKLIGLKENKSYTEIENTRQPVGNQLVTQVKLSKVKLSKESNISSSIKKPYFDGLEMRKAQGKWWVIPKGGGSWKEFAGKESEIQWEDKNNLQKYRQLKREVLTR